MTKATPHKLEAGSVVFERVGEEIIIRHAKVPELFVAIPVRVLEAWGLRKLRDDALQPEKVAP